MNTKKKQKDIINRLIALLHFYGKRHEDTMRFVRLIARTIDLHLGIVKTYNNESNGETSLKHTMLWLEGIREHSNEIIDEDEW